MTDKPNKFKVHLDWEQCEIISHYYRFPAIVFLLTKENMKERLKGIRKRIKR